MSSHSRRAFLERGLALSLGGCAWALSDLRADEEDRLSPAGLRLAAFRFDVTPPLGHSCCGGWIKPVEAVDDPLQALGIVLLGAGLPIVLCAVDWTGLLNEAHLAWRRALAEAAGTTPERVAVHCVHQHNAPMACLEAERIVAAQGDLPHILDLDFFADCLARGRRAVAQALPAAERITHVASGEGRVERVAGNRRVRRDASGQVLAMRGSSCRDEQLRSLPEGPIDPWLKTVAFYQQDRKLAALHYYATHPMSYYADGRVSSDFPGLARQRRQQEEPECLHVYFTGCAGDVAAGKYNDGSPAMRPVLAQRVYEGLLASEQNLVPVAVERIAWRTLEIVPQLRSDFTAEGLAEQIANAHGNVASRNRPAYTLAWLRRLEQRVPIVLSCLHLGAVRLLHLPGECFVEYQLRGQRLASEQFVAVAAYGDGGTWYVPTADEYPAGGYEVSVAFSEPSIDGLLTAGIKQLLAPP